MANILGPAKYLMDKRKWSRTFRAANPQNQMYPVNMFRLEDVTVGKFSYGGINALFYGKGSHLYIGSCCSIALGVVFIPSADHSINTLSSFPFKGKVLGQELTEAASKGDIVVGDDVWIGQNAIILSGVKIGQGAVVAAGAVVSADVPPYAIVGGVPAKVIRYRFSQSTIDYLLTLDYEQLSEDMIREHIDDLYTPIGDLDDAKIKEKFKWFPKRNTMQENA